MAGRRRLGGIVLGATLLLAAIAAVYGVTNPKQVLKLAVDPSQLLFVTIAIVALAIGWIAVIVTSHRMLRPQGSTTGNRALGAALVGVLCFAITAPMALTAQAAMTQRDLLISLFSSGQSATRKEVQNKEDPWAGKPRVNILLLGADDGPGRKGVRTDTVMVASIDTKTGNTALISLPRKLMFMPFPKDSPLHEKYPDGFGKDGINLQDRLEWMLDAMYQNIPDKYPGILGPSDNEGADILKVSVGEAVGLEIDYYAQINLKGFTSIVDALGGITVNINYPIPVGGSDDAKRPPNYYLQPGPNKHLMGLEALWYARGRYKIPNPDDARSARQRCAIHAIAEKANPANLVQSYQKLAAAGKNLLRTDIPQDLLPAFVELGLKVKSAKVAAVPLDGKALKFAYPHPDYDGLRAVVAKALKPKKPATKPTTGTTAGTPTTKPSKPTKPSKTVDENGQQDLKGACEYDPEPQS
ncbi:LCP family protein [Kribbella deserti]|uniref:LCP family protein n=1 Tax=Kribbella deserti TaxID=1926257 RepID=A0ABV6QM17_9ACTN